MATTSSTVIKIMNTIRENATAEYQNRVPVATATNIDTLGKAILSGNFQATSNEFLSALVNRIGMTIFSNRQLSNPLAIFKTAGLEMGATIQDIFVNPAKATPYDSKATDLLAQTKSDVKVCYYEQSRQDKYTVTITQDILRRAFVSYDNLALFINALNNSLYDGNALDEFILLKTLIGNAIKENRIVNIATSKNPSDFMISAKEVFLNFLMPSSQYNSYALQGGSGDTVQTQTRIEDICFIMRSDIQSKVDIEVLARAFNIDKVQFMGNIITVDNFTGSPECMAILCDKSFIKFYENLNIATDFFNGSTLATNYYLHVWQTLGLSPFANGVAFLDNTVVTGI